jgi:hypothetical protein
MLLFGIDEIASEIQDPFGGGANDIVLIDAIEKLDRDIRRLLCEAAGSTGSTGSTGSSLTASTGSNFTDVQVSSLQVQLVYKVF